jgi:2-haloacid dehalogenase
MNAAQIDPDKYTTVTFDCYGTLIDWENGLLGYIQPLLQSYYINTIDEFVLGLFSELEPVAQSEGGSYRSVLGRVMEQFAIRLGFTASSDAVQGLADSIQYWQPFPDSRNALLSLQRHFKLGIVSNIDDDLFAASQQWLDIQFDHLITAQRVGCYKPAKEVFETALAEITGPVLHVAQSRFHDILPATELGLDTVWINRPSNGAAKAVDADPTWTFNSMAEFASAFEKTFNS